MLLKQSQPEAGKAGDPTAALSVHPLGPEVFLKSGRHFGELSGELSVQSSGKSNKLGESVANGGRTQRTLGQAPFVVEELKAAR